MPDKSVTVDTFKSGPFHFSAGYDQGKLMGLLVEARILSRTIADLPILPDLASRLEEDIIRRSIFGTAAIEGNPLTEEEVSNVLAQEQIPATSNRAEQEIANLKVAYDIIRQVKVDSGPMLLNEGLIKDIHKTITEKIEYDGNEPGSYRNHTVHVGDKAHGGVYTPPKIYDDIAKLMKTFVSWMNSESILEQDSIIRAGLAHYYLCLIHPFGDGNGRTARVLEALLLKGSGFRYASPMLANYYYENVDDYYGAFTLARKDKREQITHFLSFYLTALVSALNKIKKRISGIINMFALRDYYAYLRKNKRITVRQHDLLAVLLEQRIKFSFEETIEIRALRIIYQGFSERTIQRDLNKLLKMGLIVKEEGKYSTDYDALLRSYEK